MLEFKPGCPARSLAGHDKDRYYIILKEDGEYVELADGKFKTTEHPKRKKKKHVQPVHQMLMETVLATDEQIRRCLKEYERDHGGARVGGHID